MRSIESSRGLDSFELLINLYVYVEFDHLIDVRHNQSVQPAPGDASGSQSEARKTHFSSKTSYHALYKIFRLLIDK